MTTFALFSASWCVPCKQFKPMIEDIVSKYPDLDLKLYDVDEQQELINKYGIRAVPTLTKIVDGKVIDNKVGVITRSQLEEFLNLPELTDSPDTMWDFFLECVTEGQTLVTFKKADGSEREMLCTSNTDYFDYDFKKSDVKETAKSDPDVKNVWDLEKNGWRRIKRGTILKVELLKDD